MSEDGQETRQGKTIIKDISNNVVVFTADRTHQQERINERREQLVWARTELEAIINDLENDYGTRDDEFWEDTIKTACDIRRTIRQYKIIPQPIAFTYINFAVDEIGIITTAYMAHCNVTTEEFLRERHRILEKLRSLLTETLKAEEIIDNEEVQG